MIRKQFIVRGRVQGVGFRYAARDEAERLSVAGFARNRPDGSVQVEAEGVEDAVDRFEAWLRMGPPGARVDAVEVAAAPPTGESGFLIRA